MPVVTNLKQISKIFGVSTTCFFKNYLGKSNYHLMANISEKAISILAGNLNSDLSYFITTVSITLATTWPSSSEIEWNL